MSAAEVIELIKKLPPKEKAEVTAFLLRHSGVAEPKAGYAGSSGGIGGAARQMPQADAERIADQILDRRAELFQKLAQ